MRIRLAQMGDLQSLEALMNRSINELMSAVLNPAQVAASFEFMGLDTQLIKDQTYVVCMDGDQIAGCGGWSNRATLFGSDETVGRDARMLDPKTEPARIRAMYTDPDFTRRGVGKLVLDACEAAARDAGFRDAVLSATLAGEPFYLANGYREDERQIETASNLSLIHI